MIVTPLVIVALALCTWRAGHAAGGDAPFIRNTLSIGPGRQVTLDPCIATTILCAWMAYAPLEVGISPPWALPCIVIAVFMTSFAPLLYLLHRFRAV